MQLSLIILTKTKANNPLLQIIQTQWQHALNKRYYRFNQVSEPVEVG
jgi:hypothetical protein